MNKSAELKLNGENVRDSVDAPSLLPFSQLRSQTRTNLASAVPLPAPYALYVEPTNVCNFRCVFCPESEGDYGAQAGYYQAMPLATFARVMDSIREMGGIRVLRFFLEGEPLLNKHLGQMIQAATSSGLVGRTEVTTNGSLLTEARAIELIASGLHYIDISVYGMLPDSHRSVTGVTRWAPDVILENVQRLRRLRDSWSSVKPFIHAKLMAASSDSEEELFRAAYTAVADEITIQTHYHNWGGLVDIKPPTAQPASVHPSRLACPYPFTTLAIKANGDVGPCCLDWAGDLTFGNVMTQSLREMWSSPALHSLRMAMLSHDRSSVPACASCDGFYSNPDDIDSLQASEYESRL